MKKLSYLVQIITFLFLVSFSFTACEIEDEITIEKTNLESDSISLETPDTKNYITGKASFVNSNVKRYYSGGTNTMHTYRYSNLGASIGTSEGISFNAPIAPIGTTFDRNLYRIGYFFLHPQNEDFVITVSASEYFNLRDNGWINKTFKRILFKKGPGAGTVPLYRFYRVSDSDHLFTRNYNEGINAGYIYEGIVGYVK